MNHTVFVYGTLKSGRSNHHLLETGKFLGDGYTARELVMYHSGFPMVCEGNDLSGKITGEVYTVDDATLLRLDRLEGHPNFFCRKLEVIHFDKLGEDPSHVQAWMYKVPNVPKHHSRYIPDDGYLTWPDCNLNQEGSYP